MEQYIYDLNVKMNYLANIQESDTERFKKIINWSGEMMDLTIKERYSKTIQPRKGEIWTCKLGENVGSELNNVRPVLVITNDVRNFASPIVTIVPISHRQGIFDSHYELQSVDFVDKESKINGTVITEQIKGLSKARFGKKIGELTEDALKNVQESLLNSLGMSN